MKTHLISYDNALALANTFMKESGIRRFCTEECKGKCCGPVVRLKKCDAKHCRNIQCATFLCFFFRYVVKDNPKLGKLMNAMEYVENKCGCNGYSTLYFKAVNDESIKQWKFDYRKLKVYNDKDILQLMPDVINEVREKHNECERRT